MDVLARIRAKINDYPGYADEDSIRRSDQEVRAYAGERLSELRERLGGAGGVLEPLIGRCAFANQKALTPLENPRETLADAQPLEDADAAVLDAIDQSNAVTPESVDEYASGLTKLFDQRDASLMRASIALRRG